MKHSIVIIECFLIILGNFVSQYDKNPPGDAHNVQKKAAAQPHMGAQSRQVRTKRADSCR